MLLDIWLTACTPCILNEAQSVVAHADSLRAEGQMYDDSVRLANACQTLHAWRMIYPDEYAHCCYHYGRLLRAKDDPVSAMEVFINAAHSRTHDRHILGRVYSNMGSLCHLASEYSLSYDMYERSADCFLRNGDSINYYYALNDMAFEKASQGEKEEAYNIIKLAETSCTNEEVLTKLLETKAKACLQILQYDSAIFYSTLLYTHGNHEPMGIQIRAQAYDCLGQKDSALYYARILSSLNPSGEYLISAFYIFSHCDTTLNVDSVLAITSNRADLQKAWALRNGQLSQSTQLLEQDLNRKPDLRWIFASIATIIVIGFGIGIYMHKKHKLHQLLSQQIDDLEKKNDIAISQMREQIEKQCCVFSNSSDIKSDLCWNDYNKMCGIVNQNFRMLVSKLQQSYNLSEKEIRLCVLSLFNLRYEQMANMLYYASNGIGKFKMRVAQKMGTTAKNLQQFLINLAINE